MGTALILTLLVGVSLVLYFVWERTDRRKEAVALDVIEDTAAMGDVVPASLHPEVDPTRCIGSGACVAA